MATRNEERGASEQTPPERPPAVAAALAAAAAAPGKTGDGNTDLQAAPADAPDPLAALLVDGKASPLYSVLSNLFTRLGAVEQHAQAARGEQVGIRQMVMDLHKVVEQNADSLDALANLIAPEPPPAAELAPVAEVLPPPPSHLRPPAPADAGRGMGGIAHQRRERGPRTFVPSGPIEAPPAPAAGVALPPMRPAPNAHPRELPHEGTATRPLTARNAGVAAPGSTTQLDVGGEVRIDPTQPGEYQVQTPDGPALIRVREQQRPGAFRRQGGGRIFTPRPGNTDGGSR